MIKSRSVSNVLFRSVCILFSLLMLVLSLIGRIKLMELEKETEELYKLIALEEKQMQILKVKLENRISLYELEFYATQTLGMHRPSAEQLYFIGCTE